MLYWAFVATPFSLLLNQVDYFIDFFSGTLQLYLDISDRVTYKNDQNMKNKCEKVNINMKYERSRGFILKISSNRCKPANDIFLDMLYFDSILFSHYSIK